MASSFFFMQAEKNAVNLSFLNALEQHAEQSKRQIFVIDKPLGDNKYGYEYKSSLLVLVPTFKLLFVDFGGDDDAFENYMEDFIEDLGSISDKYRYKSTIGRPREWRSSLFASTTLREVPDDVDALLADLKLADSMEQKKSELLISLLTGSINDIDKVKGGLADNVLDRIKQKILLFDGDQTRFVYQQNPKRSVTIQGLSGTGKTELLLHKLKDIYTNNSDSRVMFTCHNHVLSDTLRKRIPDFFTFMKVEEQIKWNERLWCVSAWGSQANINSGAYRYICEFYDLPFFRYSPTMTFDRACSLALSQINELDEDEFECAFDYILIDESQDFPESFFELCRRVTSSTVYIAGDIFQSIFDADIISSIAPDFLLSKCYRTDPRTLMFAHGLGMGLFEPQKLRWLEDPEWKACGYIVDKLPANVYRLTREPLRRFEDIDSSAVRSMEIVKIDEHNRATDAVVDIIRRIKQENPTVLVDDIGIIFVDTNKAVYALADELAYDIATEFGWTVNKAYETKQRMKDTLFVSNKNNVKGLEFPFVICITGSINSSYHHRNALYMTLTRSFIKTYLLVSSVRNSAILPYLDAGLETILSTGGMETVSPSAAEQEAIKTTISSIESNVSYFDFVHAIFEELKILPLYRQQLYEAVKGLGGESFDYDDVKETVQFVYRKMFGKL